MGVSKTEEVRSLEYILQMTKNIIPSMAYNDNDDFEEWQIKAHEKLTELLGLPFEECEDDFRIEKEEDCEKYRQITFRYQSEPGYSVPGTLLIPKGIKKPIPGVICLQGHSSGAHVSLGIPKFPGDEQVIAGGRDFAVRAVEEGYCAIALEQRYMGVKSWAQERGPSCPEDAKVSLLLGRCAIGERVWDIHRLMDVIERYLTEYIDARHIICMGNSGGGTATFYAACYDKRISVAIPSCSVCTFDDSIMTTRHCACNHIPGIRKYFNMGDLGCLIAPRPLVVVCGIHDDIFPLHGVEASFEIIKRAYKRIGKEQLCALVKGAGGHQFYPDDAWPVAKEIMQIAHENIQNVP